MWNRLVALVFVASILMAAGWPASPAVSADDPPGFEFMTRMKESLKLTDDQVVRLQPVITTRIDKVNAALATLDAAEAPDVKGFIQAYGEIRKEFEAGVMKVITLDQRQSWESFQEEVEDDLVTAGATRQLADLAAAVKLTDEQMTRLMPAMTTTIQQKLDLFQKLADSGYIDVREKHRARYKLDELNAELEKSINAVLTLDQRSACKKWREGTR